MKKIFIVLVILLFASNAFAAGTCGSSADGAGSSHCTGTDEWTADTCSVEDVNYCVDNCVGSGETLNIPAGTCTGYDDTIDIDDSITISGAGTCTPSNTPGDSDYTISCNDTTKLVSDGSTTLIHVSVSGDKAIDISGLTLDGNESSTIILVGNTSGSNPLYNIRIHHNKIENASGQAVVWQDGRNAWFGLVDHNHFHSNAYDFKIWGPDNSSLWDAYPGETYDGTVSYLYIEDNYSTGFTSFILTSGHGCRWVYRYNTVDGTSAPNYQSMLDAHGDTHNYGVVAHEVYNNYIVNAPQSWYIDLRGGTGLIYNNTTDNWFGLQIREEYVGGECIESGYDESLSVNNTYIFNNTGTGTTTNDRAAESDTGGCIAEGTDWWDDLKQCDGNGANCVADNNGTFTVDVAASRGASCTVDNCYWETDTLGLYRCTAPDTWTKVYDQYTYPHPLQGGADTTAPIFSSASIAANGTSVTINFNENVTGTESDTFDLDCDGTSGSNVTLTYSSGSGSTALVFTAGETIQYDETCNLDFDGDADEFEDDDGNDLADFTDESTSNSSGQGVPAETVTSTYDANAPSGTYDANGIEITN